MGVWEPQGRKFVVVGGTGTLGQALIRRILLNEDDHVICISRDELKQKAVKAEIGSPRVSFVLGDVRDKDSMRHSIIGSHAVFHVAALKHIDSVEENPMEGMKTNVMGTANVADLVMKHRVPYMVFSSTDKAVEPINIYGMTKAISERHLFNLNKSHVGGAFSVFRWGNVLGSRGSVLHSFALSLKQRKTIDLTHPQMTRFWIPIDEAARFMLENYTTAPRDRACIPEMKGCSVLLLAEATAEVLGVKKYVTKFIGMRVGEKLAEVIHVTDTERVTSDNIKQFTKTELVTLIKPMLEAYL